MKTVWLVGLGGIGQALQAKLKQSKHINLVTFSRHSGIQLDIGNAHEVMQYVTTTAHLPQEVIITTGVLHDEQHMPEKSIVMLDEDWLQESLAVNVMPTLHFAKALTEFLPRREPLKFVSFSARVSSISDNRLGGWYSYRMTKAMLNMLIKNIALEWRQKLPRAMIFGYHPGTVDTHLSKPFQSRIEPSQLFSPEYAACLFLSCLENRKIEHSGKLFDWREEEIMP